MNAQQQIQITRDAQGNVFFSGDNNVVHLTVFQGTSHLEHEPLTTPSASIGPNPYKGLAAFYEEDADRFFGRKDVVQELWKKFCGLHEMSPGQNTPFRFLSILGPSGSGKSSITRAGLLPELARHPLPGRQRARVAVLTPGSHPIRALTAILARIATNDPSPAAKTREFESELKLQNERGEWDGLSRIADVLPKIEIEPLIVLVDQFEEVYSLCQESEICQQFINNLLYAATDTSSHVSIILTLRSDFLGQTQNHPNLNHAIAANSLIVPVMNDDELRQAITKPAELAGYQLDTATVELLIAQSAGREGALPLLQFALTRIWEGLAEGVAPAETLQNIGGVGGALAGEAQRLYDKLSDADKAIARRAFLALVQLGEGAQDTRRRIAVPEVVAQGEDPQHVEDVLRVFAQPGARLVTLSTDPEHGETAEVTHEALFTHWGELKQWLDNNREDLRFHRRLAEAVVHWEQNDKPDGLLWRSPDLELLQGFIARSSQDMTAGQIAFFQASVALREQELAAQEAQRRRELETAQKLAAEAHARQMAETQARQEAEQRANEQARAARQLRWLVVGLSLVFLAAVSLAWYAWQKRNEATAAQNHAQQTEHQRTVSLFESYLTHASLQTKVEDFAAASTILNQSRTLDAEILPERRHARNLLAWFTDLMRGAAVQEYSAEGVSLQDVAVSPDGHLLAAVGGKGTVVLFDIASGKLLKHLEGHSEYVSSVLFHPDGTRLVTAGYDDSCILFWSIPDGVKLHKWDAPDKVGMLALSPDGNLLASGGIDKTVTVWDIESGKVLHTLTGHTADITSLAFSPDGQLLASAAGDATARIWEVATGEMRQILRGHTGYVVEVAFHPDGNMLATSSSDTTVRLWEVASGNPLKLLQGHTNVSAGLVFIDAGRRLVSASMDRTLRLWDIDSGVTLRVLQKHTAGVVSVTAKGDNLFSAGNDGIVCRWEIGMQQPQNSTLVALSGQPFAVALSPDNSGVAVGFADGSLHFYALPDARLVWEKTDAHTEIIYRLAFSPDGKNLVSASLDKTAKLWQVSDGDLAQTFNGHRDGIVAVAFKPDGSSFATASFDGKIGLFEIGKPEGQFYPAHEGGVYSVAFDASGERLASTGEDGVIRLWEGKNMQPPQSWQPPHFENSGMWVAFSPDSRRIVSVGLDALEHILNADDGHEEQTLTGHKRSILRAAFSPDGGQVVTVGRDATVRLWDLTARIELFTLRLPATSGNDSGPLWDFDFRCAGSDCWIAVPLTRGQLALYHLTGIYE